MVRVAGATLTTTGVGAGGSPEPGASAASSAALITSMPGGHRDTQPQLHLGWRSPPRHCPLPLESPTHPLAWQRGHSPGNTRGSAEPPHSWGLGTPLWGRHCQTPSEAPKTPQSPNIPPEPLPTPQCSPSTQPLQELLDAGHSSMGGHGRTSTEPFKTPQSTPSAPNTPNCTALLLGAGSPAVVGDIIRHPPKPP